MPRNAPICFGFKMYVLGKNTKSVNKNAKCIFCTSAGFAKSVIINPFIISERFGWIQLHQEWFERKQFITDDNEWHFIRSSQEMSR